MLFRSAPHKICNYNVAGWNYDFDWAFYGELLESVVFTEYDTGCGIGTMERKLAFRMVL